MSTFTVKAKNRENNKPIEFQVTKNIDITTQQDAENYIEKMPRSKSGGHPGFEVIPTVAEPPPVAAEVLPAPVAEPK